MIFNQLFFQISISYVCDIVSESIWLAADKAGLIRKQVIPLETRVCGKCEYTSQHFMWREEDGVRLERGEFPRSMWWDSECVEAQ